MRFLTAGESHGDSLIVIISEPPSNVSVDTGYISEMLALRRRGYGRSQRQQFEADTFEIISGVYKGRTTGAPIAIVLKNTDNTLEQKPEITKPRPGHADMPGFLKYGLDNIRPVLERASARETAARVCAGAIAGLILRELGVETLSFVRQIGDVVSQQPLPQDISSIKEAVYKSRFLTFDKDVEPLFESAIDNARLQKDTLGGVIEFVAQGIPPGIGDFCQWDKRLDGRLAQAAMSIQAIKAVEIGSGIAGASMPGSSVHDPIAFDEKRGVYRMRNNAGGIEGGMTNGENVVLRAFMKPIATLGEPLDTIDVKTGSATKAHVERFDTCAVEAAAIVLDAMCSFVLADAILEKFGRDNIIDIKDSFLSYSQKARFLKGGQDD